MTSTFDFDLGLSHPVPGGYKYGNLALQVWEVSDDIVKYGYGFCENWTIK
jgi:hypothetical protein